jgi:hypothetical protein
MKFSSSRVEVLRSLIAPVCRRKKTGKKLGFADGAWAYRPSQVYSAICGRRSFVLRCGEWFKLKERQTESGVGGPHRRQNAPSSTAPQPATQAHSWIVMYIYVTYSKVCGNSPAISITAFFLDATALFLSHSASSHASSSKPNIISVPLCNNRALRLRPESRWPPSRVGLLPLPQAPPDDCSQYNGSEDAESNCEPNRAFLAMTRSASASSRLKSVYSFAFAAVVKTREP